MDHERYLIKVRISSASKASCERKRKINQSSVVPHRLRTAPNKQTPTLKGMTCRKPRRSSRENHPFFSCPVVSIKWLC